MFRTAGVMVVGSIMAVGVIAGGGGSSSYIEAEGEVMRIERKCSFTVTETREDGRKIARGETDSCNSTDEFAKYKANPDKRPMDIAGTATVKVSYPSPLDQSTQTGTLEFSGRDREFYALKAHDTIKIRVAKDGSGKIKKL